MYKQRALSLPITPCNTNEIKKIAWKIGCVIAYYDCLLPNLCQFMVFKPEYSHCSMLLQYLHLIQDYHLVLTVVVYVLCSQLPYHNFYNNSQQIQLLVCSGHKHLSSKVVEQIS